MSKKKPKKVELSLTEDDHLEMIKSAHEKGIDLNTHINNIIREGYRERVDFYFEKEMLVKLGLLAHENNMTLDNYVNNICDEEILRTNNE